MGLNFGLPDFFKDTGEGDGTFARKNVQINRDDVQPILQNEGDMVLWERGEGYTYDIYNNVIDGNLWTAVATGTGAAVSETTTYIQGNVSIGNQTAAYNADTTIKAKDLSPLEDMSEITFRCTLNCSTGHTPGNWELATLKIFGLTVKTVEDDDGSTHSDDSIWKGVKNPDGTWNIFDDDVEVLSNQTALNNEIEILADADKPDTAPADIGASVITRLYTITVGGGSFLLLRSTKRTFKIDLASF